MQLEMNEAMTTTKTKKAPEDSISLAKAQGLVWTNPTTKVYHKDGPFYGKTKGGKFMTETDAIRQYYRPSPEVMKLKNAQRSEAVSASERNRSAGALTTKLASRKKTDWSPRAEQKRMAAFYPTVLHTTQR